MSHNTFGHLFRFTSWGESHGLAIGCVIAIPLGIKVSRKETSANLGVALVLAMGYYIATVAVNWCDTHPEWRPDLLMWLPNIGFQALGGWMFYKVDR